MWCNMEKKLCKIINHYGLDKQIVVWVEELSELTKELCKLQRTGIFSNNGKLEITDVQICLDQMKLAFKYNAKEQKINYDYKIDRQLGRIDKNE